ncbi:Methyltransferase domain-containing protein [Saccharicrinis carchari]|uniref:Methyltransferase domain-containing protein n=1 Tax=Saccharicrinis carchari TaxID=1168039 RepID=A0A521EFN5_SACCC|nr:class I SAM-dependent methyltransferase [Saccharicrinis carchari]SMO82698.1 Methyltransferase domain-containing protein [Saccharicrinis carchari]
MKSFWNERYASEEYIYGTQPNPQVKSFIDSIPAGRILFPGEGEGRNAIYAAMRNWDVVALDQSSVAKNKAKKLAAKYGVSFEYLLGDITETNLQPQSFDAVALSFFHLPPQLRKEIHTFLASLVKAGGRLFVVGFSKEQIHYNSGGPGNIDMLYSTSMLANDFVDFKIIRNVEFISQLNEGDGHYGPASLIEFEAIKI